MVTTEMVTSEIVGEARSRVSSWLREDLDAWTCRVVRRHFDPDDGSPYWLARAARTGFDPRSVRGYADLVRFGAFPSERLRELDPADLLPRGARCPRSSWVWETGGTAGDPSRVIYTEAMTVHRGTWRIWGLTAAGFEPGRAWLQATPSGPHIIGNGFREAAGFAGRVYSIDMDPRWVKHLLKAGRLKDAQEYTEHVVGQVAEVLRRNDVDYLSTTPALLRTLIRCDPDAAAELRGAWLSGTVITAKMCQEFTEALSPGASCGVAYGNTWGNAMALVPLTDAGVIPYRPAFPQLTLTVVDPGDWRQPVAYGDYGQVRATILHEDLFLPNVLERDQAMRYDTGGSWPWDGVANVRPLQTVRSGPEGIY
jgi:hypothetical protein